MSAKVIKISTKPEGIKIKFKMLKDKQLIIETIIGKKYINFAKGDEFSLMFETSLWNLDDHVKLSDIVNEDNHILFQWEWME